MSAAQHDRNAPSPRDVREQSRMELRCTACGYGVVVAVAPEACPMCRGTTWEYAAWRPFSRLSPRGLPRSLTEDQVSVR
jgi:hypothetical protein